MPILCLFFILCPWNSSAQTDEEDGWGSPIFISDITLDRDRENIETISLHMNRYYWPAIQHELEKEKPVLIVELIPAQAPPTRLNNMSLNGKWIQHLKCQFADEKKTLKIIIDFKPFEHYRIAQSFNRNNNQFLLTITSDDISNSQGSSSNEIKKFHTPAPPEGDASQIIAMVKSWRMAWEDKRLNDYFSFYHSEFQSKEKNMAVWKSDRERTIHKPREIAITVSDLHVTIDGETAKAFFIQQYKDDTYEDKGYKILELKKTTDNWKIYREEWFAQKPNQWSKSL